MSEIILGIDLGTSNSAACIFRDGKLEIVPSAEGTSLYGKAFPSYVAFTKEGDLLVGEPAKKQANMNPENTISEVKRRMGRKNCKYNIQGKEYTPQQISGYILQKIKADAEKFVGEEIRKAIITIPANFNDNQRTATKDAGRIAGLEVLRLLPEPTAASLAYGIDRQSDDDLNILVFDIGGGTLDVTIMEFGSGIFEVQSTSGDTKLGGTDMDNAIMHYIAEEFNKEHNINLLENDESERIIRMAAEKAKIELSNTIETEIIERSIASKNNQPLHLNMTLNRSKLEQLVRPIVERCGETIQKALDDAVLESDDIDKVILVGGPTRMPIVKKYVEDFLGKSAEGGIDPMECVCQGAAIQGGVMGGAIDNVILVDVTPLSLGTEVQDGSTSVIIKRNTPIPITKSDNYTTVFDNQTSVNVNVVQGERRMAVDNTKLGSFILDGIPPLPKGVPQIEITYEIDSDGILNASAVEKSTGKKQAIRIEGAMAMDDAEIERCVKEAEEFAERDRQKHIIAEAKNKADNAIYSAERFINDPQFANTINSLDKDKVQELISQLRLAIANEDLLELNVKTNELNNLISELGQ